jgi:hypothetical protein
LEHLHNLNEKESISIDNHENMIIGNDEEWSTCDEDDDEMDDS